MKVKELLELVYLCQSYHKNKIVIFMAYIVHVYPGYAEC